ncbi:nuclear protein 2 [Monodelphis domestica]|uniref:nuclear protein 2 n=1 Tax=Monodelphis domestica TaxID=13616 RepID=UPI00020F6301|nr:nuclear protein 2 [Monodelphis domestica]XP_056675683.1 nuclear protein 2 [Monodelphis domestica]
MNLTPRRSAEDTECAPGMEREAERLPSPSPPQSPPLRRPRLPTRQKSQEELPLANFEEEHYDCYDYYNLREYPIRGPGWSKGRTRRERELRTNRPVPAGHERKIAQKLYNSQRKRRQRQLQSRPRTRLS